jgi:hypothetical protein
MSETPIGMPIVNLNGTELEQLLKQHHQVLVACRNLADKLGMAAPHGRDYQTSPDGSLDLARKLWLARYQYVSEIKEWAELRLTDLMRQNIERNGSDKAYELVRRVIP